MSVTAPDLAHGVPRSGRDLLGGWAWLARLADKVRAAQAGTAGEYVAYCPLSMGFLRAAGISRSDFDQLVSEGAGDAELAHWFDRHSSPERKDAANAFVLEEHAESLDAQDQEEGRTGR